MKNKFKKFMACLLVMMLMSVDVCVIAEEIVKSLTLPLSLQIIEEEAFYRNTSIEKVVVPEGTTEIRSKAFAYSSLAEINLPESLTFIADDAFEGCGEFSVSVPKNCYAFDWCLAKGLLDAPVETPVSDFTYTEYGSYVEITSYSGTGGNIIIPEKINEKPVQKIGKRAFDYCDNLKSVTIPDSITEIGEYAFYYCEALENVDFSDNLISVGNDAFAHCDNLESINLPISVRSIGDYAFYYCTGLKTVAISEGATSIGEYAFAYCRALMNITLPDSINSIGENAFYYCTSIMEIDLPANLATIEHSTFNNCSQLKNITLPENLQVIGGSSFSGCSSLKNIAIPEGVTTISSNAFYGCYSLEEIVLPDTVVVMENSVFYHCSGLKTVVLSKNLTEIDVAAFAGCTGITEIIIHNKVAAIQYNAFSGCTNLKSVTIPASVETFGTTVFANCNTDLVIYSVSGSKAEEYASEYSITFVAIEPPELDVPANVTAEAQNSESIQITWDKVEGAAGYYIYRSTSDNGIYAKVQTITSESMLHYTDFDLDSNTTYYYKVSAFDANGESMLSSYTFAKTNVLSVTSITMNEISLSMKVGEFATLTATVNPSNASNKTLNWSTSASDVAMVDGNGVITAKGVGTATIRATATDGSGKYASCVVTVSQHAVTPDAYFTYEIRNNSYARITKYEGTDAHVVVPSEIGGYPVNTISGNAFADTNVISVFISEGIKEIGSWTFDGCGSLTTVHLPDSLNSLGSCAFYECSSLTSVNIPETLSRIEGRTFMECSSLKNIVLPEAVCYIGERAFFGCSSLASINLPEVVSTIENRAFYECSNLVATVIKDSYAHTWCEANSVKFVIIGDETPTSSFTYSIANDEVTIEQFIGIETNVVIPNEIKGLPVTHIDGWAFKDCSDVESITIPKNVNSIGSLYTFHNCTKLVEINVVEENEYFTSLDGVLYNRDMTTLVACPAGRTGEFAVPEGVADLAQMAFATCDRLTAITLPQSLKMIYGAFEECSGITSITIPKNVWYIVNGAFSSCSSLESIYVEDGNRYYVGVDGVLYNDDMNLLFACPNARSGRFVVPNNVDTLNHSAFENCNRLTEIILHDGITSMGQWAFCGCRSLKSIELPLSITEIPVNAFRECSNLESIIIPTTVTSIEYGAFRDCTNLVSAVIPEEVTSIGDHAFDNCSEDLIIYGFVGSTAQVYAEENDIEFHAMVIEAPVLDMKSASLNKEVYEAGETIIISGIRVKATDYVKISCSDDSVEAIRVDVINSQEYQTIEDIELVIPATATEGIYNFSVVAYDNDGDVSKIDVDTLTYSIVKYATICGTVANADDRTNYVDGASVEILDYETHEQEMIVYSDENGEYTAVIPGGTYVVRISADGYLAFTSVEKITGGETVYLETYLLVEGDESSIATGTISGKITNAVNGYAVANAQLTVREGWNATEGDVVTTTQTASDGSYTLTLSIGNYTISIDGEGYIATSINVAVTVAGNMSCHAPISPDGESTIELGDMRIILTWGSSPSDLDSHLWGPTADGTGKYHIYFDDKEYNYDGDMRANLDLDDRSSYGPETTTIYDMTNNGVYSYYIHDYSHKDYTGSTYMANSGAQVKVLMGETEIATYNVPTSGVGNVWHVFDFDAVNGLIRGVNTFSDESNAGEVGVVYPPTVSNFTLNSASTEISITENETITFGGTINAGSAKLVDVQVSIFDADNPEKGIKYARFEDINADTFDLTRVAPIIVGATYSDENQTLTMEAGKSYIVMLFAADANGNGFNDVEPNKEEYQGPYILVHDEEATNTVVWNDHTYQLINQSMTWTEAKAYCESIGGHLVTITSYEEQKAIEDLLDMNKDMSKPWYWIGLENTGSEFVWVTGEAFAYENWASGEPNSSYGGREKYGELFTLTYGTYNPYEWNDSINEAGAGDEHHTLENHGFICEFDEFMPKPSVELYVLSNESVTEGDSFSISGTIKGNGSNVKRVTISAFLHDDHGIGVHLQSLAGSGETFDLSQFSPIKTDCAYSDNEGRIMSLSGGNTYDIVIYATLANGEYFRNDTNPTQTIVVNKETVDAPDVLSVEFDLDSVAVNEEVGITVETDADAEQLYMYGEDLSWGRCGSWAVFDSNTIVEDDKRIWNITYAFNMTGNRTLTFYASKDGRNEGECCDASIEVYEPVYTGISVENFTLSKQFAKTNDIIELSGIIRGYGSNLSEVNIVLVENEDWDNAVCIASYKLDDDSFDLAEETDPIIVGETYGDTTTYGLTSRSSSSPEITMKDGNNYEVGVLAALENGEVLNDGYGLGRFLRVQNEPEDTAVDLKKVEFEHVPKEITLYDAREGIEISWDESQQAFYKLEFKLDTEEEYKHVITNYGFYTLYFDSLGKAKEVQLRLSAVTSSKAGETTTATIPIQTLGELSFLAHVPGTNSSFDISKYENLNVFVGSKNAVKYDYKGIFINKYPSGSDQSGIAVDTIYGISNNGFINISRQEFLMDIAGLIVTNRTKASYFKLAVTPYDEEGNAGTTRWIGFKLVNGRLPAANVSFDDDLPAKIESGKAAKISWTPTSDNVLYYKLYYRHSTWKENKLIRVEAPATSAEIVVSSTEEGAVFLSLYAVLSNDNHSYVDKTITFEKSAVEDRDSLIPFQQTDARWNSIPYGLYAKAGTAGAHTAYIGLDYKRGYGQEGHLGCTAHENCSYLNKENSHYYGSGCGILSTFNALYAMNADLQAMGSEEITSTIKNMAEYSLSNGLRVDGTGTSHAFPKKYISTHYADDYSVGFAGLGNSRPINNKEWDEIDTCLNNNGAVVINVPGHFMTIVGIRKNSDTGNTEYLLWDSAKSSNRKTSDQGRAWLEQDEFVNKLTIRDYTTITPR